MSTNGTEAKLSTDNALGETGEGGTAVDETTGVEEPQTKSIWLVAENIINDHQWILKKIETLDNDAVVYIAEKIYQGLPIDMDGYSAEWSPMQLNRRFYQNEPLIHLAPAVSEEFLSSLSRALICYGLAVIESENFCRTEETLTTVTMAKKYLHVYSVRLTVGIWWSRTSIRFVYDHIQVYYKNGFLCSGRIDQEPASASPPTVVSALAADSDQSS